MVGRDQCVVQTTAETVITCITPQRDEPVVESVTVSGHTPHCTHCSYHYYLSGVIWTEFTTTFQVSFGQNINNSVGQLEYVSMAPAVDIAPIAGGIIGGMVLLICVILFLLFLKIVHHRLCSHERLLPLSFVSPGLGDEIEMTDNIVYQTAIHTSWETLRYCPVKVSLIPPLERKITLTLIMLSHLRFNGLLRC